MARWEMLAKDNAEQQPRAHSAFERRVVGHVVGALTLAGALAFLWIGWMIARPLALLVAAIILGNALEPIVHALTHRMRRSFAIGTIAVSLLALVTLAVAVIVPAVDDQVAEFTRNLPTMIQRGQQLIRSWLPFAQDIERQLVQSPTPGGGSTGAGNIASYPLTIVTSAFEVVLVVFMALYWLVAMPTMRELLLSLLPPEHTPGARAILSEIGETMGGYVRGVLIEACLIGVLVFGGLSLIGVPYALALAVLAGVGEFLPYVGPIVAAVPAVLLALLESPTMALIVVAFYVVLQLIEGYVLFPLVVGNQAEIPPLLIIVGLLAGGALGGVLGALIAVPLAGAVRIVALRLLVPALRQRTGGIELPAE